MRRILLTVLTFSFLFTGCFNDDNALIPVPDIADYSHLYSGGFGWFFEKYGEKPQAFSINAQNFNKIVGDNGTTVRIDPNSFCYPNGNLVTGNVQFFMIEWLTVRDMMMSNTPTISQQGILHSGGELLLYAWKDNANEPLEVCKPIQIDVVTDVFDADMDVYTSPGIVPGQGLVWSIDPTPIVEGLDTPSQNPTYQFWFNELTWINVDALKNNADGYTGIKMKFVEPWENWNLEAWVVIPSMNAVAPIYYLEEFDIYTVGQGIPVGVDLTVVMLSQHDNGDLYAMFKEINVTKDMELDVSLTKMSEVQIQNRIDDL